MVQKRGYGRKKGEFPKRKKDGEQGREAYYRQEGKRISKGINAKQKTIYLIPSHHTTVFNRALSRPEPEKTT